MNYIEKIPTTPEELKNILLEQEIFNLRDTALYLNGVLQHRQWHNIKLYDNNLPALKKLFSCFLNEWKHTRVDDLRNYHKENKGDKK